MTATPVSKRELVRLLVIEHGQKRAAELSGEPYEKVRKWTQRGNWLASQSVPNGVPATVDRISDELAECEHESRLSLARSVKRLSKDAEEATLRHSGEVKNVAQTAAIVHKWDAKSTQANVMVNIALLGVDPGEVQASGTVVDNEA